MTRTVFRPGEIIITENKVFLEPPLAFAEATPLVSEEAEHSSSEEVYEGPSIEELRREAEQFRVQWEAEKETMIRSAKLEVDNIIQKAEEEGNREVTRRIEEAELLKQTAQTEAERIIADAQSKAQELSVKAQASIEVERKKALEEGNAAGRESGFQQGKVEVDRLIHRTQVVLERAQEKRGEILLETEQRIIDMVILIARKVIKVISENQREVIISNIKDALNKVKGRGDIIIRVHTADLQVATANLKEFIHDLEGSANIQVQEDSATIDQGGCIIETDFGEIDARIASQLAELESKIMEITPVKLKPKSPSKKDD